MHLIVVEHEEAASIGRLAPHLTDHRVTMVRPSEGDTFPAAIDAHGVIVLGGSMSAYEEDAHPWLGEEKRWITGLVADEVPMLGICLGSQLLADATGGRAHRAEGRLEAGVLELHLTNAGRSDPVVTQAGPTVFTVHGDTFELPPNATLLAHTDDYQQAFRIGSALGVQFHPETTAEVAIEWAGSLIAPVIERSQVSQADFAAQLRAADDELSAAANGFFGAWIDQVAANRSQLG